MAISKRLRYEILRRDNHACRYCGATAPDVKLTVDHVTPVALGGTDDVTNLVTACSACNSGKSASTPDAAVVADVKANALLHAQVLQAAYAVLVERISEREDYEQEFYDEYGWGLPGDWQNSIGRFYEMGVPLELVVDAARKTTRLQRTFPGVERFKYFCGMVWNQVSAVDAVTSDKAYLDGNFLTTESIDDQTQTAWRQGWDYGFDSGYKRAVADQLEVTSGP